MVVINNTTTPNYAPQQAIAQVQPIQNTNAINEKQAVIQPKNDPKISGDSKPVEGTKPNKQYSTEKKDTKPTHISSASVARVSVNAMSLQEIT